jgi:hypothetical protein
MQVDATGQDERATIPVTVRSRIFSNRDGVSYHFPAHLPQANRPGYSGKSHSPRQACRPLFKTMWEKVSSIHMLHSLSTCFNLRLQEISRAACEKDQTRSSRARMIFRSRIQATKQREERWVAATSFKEWSNYGCSTLGEHDCMNDGKETLSSGCMMQLRLANARIASMNLTCSIPMVLGFCATIATMFRYS